MRHTTVRYTIHNFLFGKHFSILLITNFPFRAISHFLFTTLLLIIGVTNLLSRIDDEKGIR